MTDSVNVIGFEREGENYIFAFTEAGRPATLEVFRRFAADPELSFTWYDYDVLKKVVLDKGLPDDTGPPRRF